MNIEIREMDKTLAPKAKALVFNVFKWMDIPEKMSFWVHKHQNNRLLKLFMRLIGGSAFSRYWVALDDRGEVCGTTGLYTEKSDENEALWLSWFCVDPRYRGAGIGKKLLEFSVDMAKSYDKKYLRLYTSTDESEADAQFLYEKYEFKVVKTEELPAYTIVYRERAL